MTSPLYNSGVTSDPFVCDSVTISLYSTEDLNTPVISQTSVLYINGISTCFFPCSMIGSTYYISVRGRNTVEICSKEPLMLTQNAYYDFVH